MGEKRPTLVLTGATGFIGKHIASWFTERNWHVVGIARCVPLHHSLNVLYLKHDLTYGEDISLPDDIDVFIHAGYIKQENGNDAFQLNTEGAQNLLKAMREKNVPQKIFLSSLSAGENALSVYGRQKAAIEKLFLEENGTVIRAGLVLGNGGLFGAMKEYLKHKSMIPLFGNGQQPLQTVFVDDLVQSLEQVISKKLSGKFVVAVDEPVAYKQFYKSLADHVHAKPRFMRMPYWLASFAINLGNFFGIKLPITKDNLSGLKQMKKIPSADDLKRLDVKLRDYKESFGRLD